MTFGVYKHMSCIDIQMYVTAIHGRTKDYIKITAYWYNPLYESLAWPDPDEIFIKTKDLWKWHKID